MSTLPFDIVFYEAFAEEEEALKKYLPKKVRVFFTSNTIQEEDEDTPPSSFISIRTQSKIPYSWSLQLKAILSRSTGFDHLQSYRAETQNPIEMGYLPHYCSRAVGEQALLLWMALLRKLPQQARQFDRFNRDGLTGFEILDKTLLVVGVGNIGWEIAQLGKNLGMRVIGVEVDIKHSDLEYVSIDKGLPQADVIVCAMNLNQTNKGFFNYALLSQAKPSAVFVNISRGELSPLKDLWQALLEKKLSGLALDVFDEEKKLAVELRQGNMKHPSSSSMLDKLRSHPNVILTPHNAFNTAEALDRKSEQSVRQAEAFFQSKKFLWSIPES